MLAAISCLTSSHSPPLRGAANACSCMPLSPFTIATQAPCSSATLICTSKPSLTGISRLPQSIRSASG